MIQKMDPPSATVNSSVTSTPVHSMNASVGVKTSPQPSRNPAPVNRPVSLGTPSQVIPARPMANVVSTALSKYEQTQKFLKDQILSVQRKSRNMKDTERSLLFQSIAALSASVALVLAFIFFFFPLLIRFAGNLGSLAVFPQTDTIPPRVPAFAAPAEAIQEASIEIKGFGEPKSQVIAVKNGSQGESTTVDDNGDFNMRIGLNEGDNKIALYSVDQAKNESSLSQEYNVKFDKTPPEVDWQTPEDKLVVKNLREQSLEVKGKVNEKAKVYLNDQFVSSSSDGSFSTQFQLQQGDNTLTLKVMDMASNETTIERTVSFKP